MREYHLFRCFYVLFIISFLFSICIDGKGFGGGRGGGGFKGGSRGGGSFGGSKGAGTFGGSSSYNRGNSYGSYNSMNKPRSGSFKQNAMSFGAGALGGVAAYSLMRSMSSSYHSRPGYYEPGYGGGDTCVNNEDLNGTRFGQFRCPLNGFPYEARSCCGDYGKQYCCIPEGTSRVMRGSSNFGWILLLIIVVLIGVFLFVRHRRQNQKDVVMVPMEPPPDERQGPAFYQPAPPPMGYPSPPPQAGNPYAVPPQNYGGNFNPYPQQQPMPYPQQQQMPYPPQQQPYHPYQVKEGGPPAYDEAMYNNQGAHATKPI